MTKCIQIDPDGTITEHASRPLDAAHYDTPMHLRMATRRSLTGAITHTSVVTCSAPFLDGGTHVLVIDDFGAQDQPINRLAWACYGRSQIFGTAYLGRDDGEPLSDEAIVALRSGIANLPIDQRVIHLLLESPEERPDMLAVRPN